LGHAAEARQWLDQAVQAIERATKEPDETGSSSQRAARQSWTDRLELDLLRREAQSLLGEKHR
jgi:hypothetical protein